MTGEKGSWRPKGAGRGANGGGRGGGGPGRGRGQQSYQPTGRVAGSSVEVDPAKAKSVIWTWLQRTQQTRQPGEHVTLECSRGRRGHSCTAWVWLDDAWRDFAPPEGAQGCFASRAEAVAAAYAAAVQSLGVPVPADCALSDEKKRKRLAEERKREQAAKQRAETLQEALRDLEMEVLKAHFPSTLESSNADGGFRTPREREDETLPAPLPLRLPLPAPVEAKGGEEKGNKSLQTLKTLVKREGNYLEGPTLHELQRQAPGGPLFVCVYALLFDRGVAILGVAYGSKRGAARAAAAASLLTRLDVQAALPTREEAGPHASEVVELKRLSQLQSFKVWAFEGSRPEERLSWFGALWGQVPFGGGLRDFRGHGIADTRELALGSACSSAASALTRLLGSSDCVTWLQKMARVVMDVQEVSTDACKAIGKADEDDAVYAYQDKLKDWLAARRRSAKLVEPPDMDAGAAPTAPQGYELESQCVKGSTDEKAKEARGVPKLPVRDLRGQLAQELEESSCLVVSGGTGSGKSTQIPQYIADDFVPEGVDGGEDDGSVGGTWRGPARIIVTEPRRIAAISLAERVAWERGEGIGRSVGYSVRGDSKPPRNKSGATVEYCTVGILLRRLQRDPSLQQVSHVLVDEVHERDLMTDFLLILLKELLCTRSDLRVLLMSATLDVRTFSNYLWGCPCLEIPTGPRYEVQEIHLEDAAFAEPWAGGLAKTLLSREEEARRLAEENRGDEEANDEEEGDNGDNDEPTFRQHVANAWWGSSENDETYMDVMTRLVMHLASGPALLDDDDLPGSVLCFLPGWAEIKSVADRLAEADYRRQQLWVVPLHSTLPKEEQQLIFSHAPAGKTKVVLATNIAESSVTIDDVLVVVDAGLCREVSYDPVRRLSTLETIWVSQSSAIQRMGRAGRVRKGRCFRLYSRTQLEQAPWRSPPEMQRCELSSTCLQALALQREVRDFLKRAPDPPSTAAVETALEELLQLNAVCPMEQGSKARDGSGGEGAGAGGLREQMMPLGEALSRMTLSPTLGRMLILGSLFGATEEACLLAAVVTAPRRVFACPPGKKKESLSCTRGFSPTSDTLAAYNACRYYEGWKLVRSEAYADRWASELFLVPKRVKCLLQARDMHWEELQRAGLCVGSDAEESLWGGTAGLIGLADGEDRIGGDLGDFGVEDGVSTTVPSAASPRISSKEEPVLAEDSLELVKALLVCAHPKNLALRRRVTMAKHNTASGLEAVVAPQSVNAPPAKKASSSSRASASNGEELGNGGGGRQTSWWSYGTLHISSKQGFLRTTTLVDSHHVALFGGLTATEDDSGALRELDGWIEVRGPRSSLRAMARLREAMWRAIHLRTLEPGTPLPSSARDLLKEVAALLRGAAPRQERIAALLPDAPAVQVEQPPPMPAGRRQGKAASGKGGKASGGKGGYKGDKGYKGKASSSWSSGPSWQQASWRGDASWRQDASWRYGGGGDEADGEGWGDSGSSWSWGHGSGESPWSRGGGSSSTSRWKEKTVTAKQGALASADVPASAPAAAGANGKGNAEHGALQYANGDTNWSAWKATFVYSSSS
eukprot:TRINITY_DN5397_c0_g3_i2.p1 TRINITY_DN5397_c0_g3~~TRINITY_DN5397_c0_g3_i2.p1  ORF type:complete len:1567 (+),score=348.17 TRINITY_DN5397_c0_g3_i2:195-4895(+)